MFYRAFFFVYLSVCLLPTSYKTTDRIFTKIVPEVYFRPRKSQLNFSRPDLDPDGIFTTVGKAILPTGGCLYSACVCLIVVILRDQLHWRRFAPSECFCFYITYLRSDILIYILIDE